MTRCLGLVVVVVSLSACQDRVMDPALEGTQLEVQLAVGTYDWPSLQPTLSKVDRVRIEIHGDEMVFDTVIPLHQDPEFVNARLALPLFDLPRSFRVRAVLGTHAADLFSGELPVDAPSHAPVSATISLAPVPGRVVLTRTVPTFRAMRDQFALSASVLFQNADTIWGAEVDWSVDDPAVAEVIADAILVPRGNGRTSVVASHGPVSRSRSFWVMQEPIALNGLAPADTTVNHGATFQLRPFGVDRTGVPLLPGTEIDYTATGPLVVDSVGTVLAGGVGEGTITATVGPQSLTVTVTVEP